MSYLMCIVSPWVHQSLLGFRNSRQHFSTVLGAILTSKLTNKNPKMKKKSKPNYMALNRKQKDTC